MTITLRKSLNFVLKSAMLLIACFCLSCSSDDTKDEGNTGDGGGTEEPGGDEYEDIKVVDGKVRFYLYEDDNAARKAMGVAARDWGKAVIAVNGSEYDIETDSVGRCYVTVKASSSDSYNATLTTEESDYWLGTSLYADIKLPYSQFSTRTATTLDSYPMYASYTKETGNKLIFRDAFAVIDVLLKGSANIVSIKVENIAEQPIAGLANFLPSRGYFNVTEGVDFVVLNCTEEGEFVPLTSSGKHFYVMLAGGAYNSGLKLTITDSDHRAITHEMAACQLEAGRLTTVELNYSPAENLLFYESFDNFVWGGDIMGGADAVGYAPSDAILGINDGTDLTGYEDAFVKVAYNSPGSGYMQSNTWNDVSGNTLATSHQMSESYIKSRNICDYTYMFRTQEYQGCVAIGTASTVRGIVQTPPMRLMDGIRNLTVSFDMCLMPNMQDDFLFQVVDGGMIKSVMLDGVEYQLDGENLGFVGNASKIVVGQNELTIPSNVSDPKNWHHFKVEVENATDGTAFYWASNTSTSGINHGFYLDNIVVYAGEPMSLGKNNLRVLYWNIQNGMWADQGNSYDNFVAWVKKYDPDICIWCESETNYQTNSASGMPASQRFLPDGWPSLAARYGHAYTARGGDRDNFSQTVTSKLPIKTIAKLTNSDEPSKPISHGAGLHSITVDGTELYIATAHMWPQAYAYGDSSQSSKNHEGDYYREFEMAYIVEQFFNNPEYASQQNWLFAGDFNSRSRADNWYYAYPDDDPRLLTQDQVRNNTDLIDIIAERYPGYFVSTTGGNSRIDYMYASPMMYNRIINAMVLIDNWTRPVKTIFSNFYIPSDHRPILVDFEM